MVYVNTGTRIGTAEDAFGTDLYLLLSEHGEDTVFSPDLGKALFGDSLYDLATHERKPVDMGGERALFTPDGSRALAVSHRTGVEIRVL